jgi:hypothetical protein
MQIDHDTTKHARIQRTPEGRRRSCAVGISAEFVERYMDNSTKTRNFNLIAAIELKEVHHRKCWQQRLVARFWAMVARTALLALFSWMLRELMELVLLWFLQTA